MAQQLAQLAKGSALLEGRGEVNEDDLGLVRRVTFDSIRVDRRVILDCLAGHEESVSITTLADETRLSQSSVSRRVEELHGLGVVKWEQPVAGFDESCVWLSDLAGQLLKGATSHSEKST